MSVISRLQLLTGEDPKAPGGENGGQNKAEAQVRLRARIDAILSQRPEGQRTEAQPTGRGRCVPLEELVPGEETTNEAGIAELIISKQRNGPTGTVKVRFVASCTRFENLAPGEYEEHAEFG